MAAAEAAAVAAAAPAAAPAAASVSEEKTLDPDYSKFFIFVTLFLRTDLPPRTSLGGF